MQVQSLGREDPLVKGMAGNSLQYICLENPKDRGAPQVGYSPQGCKELDTAQLNTHTQKKPDMILVFKKHKTTIWGNKQQNSFKGHPGNNWSSQWAKLVAAFEYHIGLNSLYSRGSQP